MPLVEVPEVVVLRLPLYVRALTLLQGRGTKVISSKQLGSSLQITPAQIRKDLSYFGRFGKQGRGYNVAYLINELRQILGLNRDWNACLVGVGRLGRAIISYPGFQPEGFKILAAFDDNPIIQGKIIDGLIVRSMAELDDIVKENDIMIGIVAVPALYAQNVINQLVACGVKAILSYAPIAHQVPDDVQVRSIDPVLSLQSATYYLRLFHDKKTVDG